MKMTATLNNSTVKYKVGDKIVLHGTVTKEEPDECELSIQKVEVPKKVPASKKGDPIAFLKSKQRKGIGAEAY